MPEHEKRNISRFNGYIERSDREKLHGHKGAVVWLTGFSASGKSTIAHDLEKRLYEMACAAYVLDGDNVRHGLCADLGFAPCDRSENIRRIGEMAHLFVDAGIILIAAFISPDKTDRQKIRALIGEENFVEVFVDCPISVCRQRDPKGIYKKAMAGEIENFTGVSAKYDRPENPHITIKSHEESIDSATNRLIAYLKQRHFIHGANARIRAEGKVA
jgi:adenylylsulfate kinase